MRPIALLAVLALTASAAPAFAQSTQAPAQASAQTPVQPTEQEIEAAAEAFGAVVEALEAQASVIRADATLTDAEKEARISALIGERADEIEAFLDMLKRYVVGQALAEGMSAEEAAQQAEMVRGLILMSLAQALVEGPQADATAPQ